MPHHKQAADIISQLERGNFLAECPCGCNQTIRLADAGLFHLDDFSPKARQAYDIWKQAIIDREKELAEQKKKKPLKIKATTRSVNIGFILERIAPSMKTFAFVRNDCRSLFDPIDYLIFSGLTRHRRVDRLVFTDIKTGNARLNSHQQQVRTAVEKKKVEFDVYRAGRQP